jgi:hypothetical protein
MRMALGWISELDCEGKRFVSCGGFRILGFEPPVLLAVLVN